MPNVSVAVTPKMDISKERMIELVTKVINLHCSKNGFLPAMLKAKAGPNISKRRGDINLTMHRQLLALYCEEHIPITKKTLGPYLGYSNHTNIIYNVKKIKWAIFKGDQDLIYEYNRLCSYADKVVPKYDFYQDRAGKFIFSKDEY